MGEQHEKMAPPCTPASLELPALALRLACDNAPTPMCITSLQIPNLSHFSAIDQFGQFSQLLTRGALHANGAQAGG